MKERQIDSTRGASDLNPLNYKGDVLVQVWLDSRVLATLSDWLDKYSDSYPRFLSELVRKPLEILVEHIVNEGNVKIVDDTATARRMLQGRYKVNLNKGNKGRKNILHNQILSDKRNKLSDNLMRRKPNHVDVVIEGRRTSTSPEELRKMTEMCENLDNKKQIDSVTTETRIDWDEEMRKSKEEGKKERLEEIERAKETMVVIPDEEVIIKEGMSDEELLKDREEKDKKRMELENAPIDVKNFNLVKQPHLIEGKWKR